MEHRCQWRGLSLLFVLSLTLSVSGCGGGSTSAFPNTATPLPPPTEIFELAQRSGGAGQVITFRATSIDSDPANLRVEFADLFQSIRFDGAIIDVRDDGTQPGLGTIWAVDVVVPGGVRSGSVSLFSNGFAFGGFGFDAAPEVIGVVVGTSGDFGAVARDSSGTLFPDTVNLYGYNLSPGVTSVTIDDGTSPFTAPNLTFGPPAGAGFNVPTGMQMLQVSLPGNLTPGASRLTLQCQSLISAGNVLFSSEIDVPIVPIPLGGLITDGEIPAFFSGTMVPPGGRRGVIAVDYAFLMDPAAERYEVIVEYEDRSVTPPVWAACTAAPGTILGARLPGTRAESPGNALIGLGSAQRFLWDSEADLPGTGGGPIVTRIRLRVPLALPANGEWISPRLVIDNDAPLSGVLLEEFDDTLFLDPAGGSAIWSSGELSAPASGGSPVPQWGLGFTDLTLFAGSVYVFDTDARTLTDVTDIALPIDLLPTNPGVPFGEFHLRTLTIEPLADVSVLGSAPLVIRCAGDGIDTTLALSLASDLSLDGSDGSAGTATDPGLGGAGGPGGSAGGDGASIAVSGATIISVDRSTDGAGGGGLGGQSTGYVQPTGASSLPRAGCGGGGGGGTAGEDAVSTLDTNLTAVANPGGGGAARGDLALTLSVGGSGGGGGGACVIRVSTLPTLTPKHGGGGGGGGGALEIAVRGRAELHAGLFARGGAGATGSSGAQAGAGGGGGGGSIAVRSTGMLTLFDTASISVAGGLGAIPPGNGGTLRGGNGAAGTVRLETNDIVVVPTPIPPGLVVPTATEGPFLAAGRSLSRGRSLPYRLTTLDGTTVGSFTSLLQPVILLAPGVIPSATHFVALFEGASPSLSNPNVPGDFRGLVGDPSLLEDAEYIRVRWFLYSSPGALSAVESLRLPFDH